MNTILIWAAKSPIASFLRVFTTGILGWVIINADTLNLHPALVIGLVSSLPIIIVWLNPADERYGKKS